MLTAPERQESDRHFSMSTHQQWCTLIVPRKHTNWFLRFYPSSTMIDRWYNCPYWGTPRRKGCSSSLPLLHSSQSHHHVFPCWKHFVESSSWSEQDCQWREGKWHTAAARIHSPVLRAPTWWHSSSQALAQTHPSHNSGESRLAGPTSSLPTPLLKCY